MKLKIDNIPSSILKLFKTIFLTLALWLSAFSLQEIDPGYISEDILHYIYYEGRNTHTVLYDDIKKTDENKYHNTIKEYYSTIYDSEVDKLESNIEPDLIKQNFTNTLIDKYGNNTILEIDIKDLEVLVNTTILSDVESFIFWESLLHYKTDRSNRIYNRNELDSEIYLFNFIPLKSQAFILFSLLIFLVIHNIQIYLIRKDKTTVIYNIFSISFSLFLAYKLYSWKYYLSSCIIFFQLCLSLKFMIDSLLLHIGYTKEDFDIFISISKTKDGVQFKLRLLVYSLLAIIIGLLVLLYFNYILNYIIFYICVIQILYLISFYFQYEVSPYFQPFKHVLLLIAGIINLFITNRLKNDSFYILSDCFSFMCISFISDYLFTQVNNISHLFYEKDIDGDKLNEKITEILKDIKDQQKSFFEDENDFLWLIVFKFGFILNFIGYYYSNYITFYFSLHYFKLIYKVFRRNYNVRCLRLFYGFLFFILIITNHLLKHDDTLYDILGLTNSGFIFLIKPFLKIIGIIYIIGLVMINNDFFFNFKKESNDEIDAEELFKNVEISATIEKKKKKRTKTIEIIIKEPSLKLSSILYVQADLYLNYFNICLMFYLIKDIEKTYIILCLYIFCLAIFVIRILFIMSEMKNDYEYLIAFTIAMMLGLRLMTITRDYYPLYVCSCFYMLLLITLYCIVYRRRLLVTILIIFHLFSACLYFTSAFLLILIAIVICLPTAFKKEEKRFSHSTVTIVVPCVIIVILQLYGVRNIFARLHGFEESIKDAFQFDIFGFVQRIIHGYRREFYLLEKLFEIMNKIN
jgi:hypothetical protein